MATSLAPGRNTNPKPNSDSSFSAQDVSQLLTRVSSLEQSVQWLLSDKKRMSSQQHLLHMEQQLETCSSPRLRERRVPYPSTVGQRQPVPCVFQMPLHYPRYSRADYEAMAEWQLDRLLEEYGLPIPHTLAAKREQAIGTFLWKCQRD